MKMLLIGLFLAMSGSALAQSQCTFRLLDEYNREVSRVSDYNCNEARSACEREKQYQIYNGLIRYGICEQMNQSGGGGQYGQCEVALESSIGTVIRTFYGTQCSFALSQCEMERIKYESPYQSLICRIKNEGPYYPPYPGPGSYSCTFEVKDVRNQMIVARHVLQGQTEQLACQNAYNVCQDDARRKNQASGGYQNFICQKANGSQYPGGQLVTRTCGMNIISSYGKYLDRTQASVSGYDANQAQYAACDQATNQCRQIIRERSIHGPQSAYYNARCERF